MLHLVFGAGGEGAEQALLKVFECDLGQGAPHRSSFCRQRKQLSWRYDFLTEISKGFTFNNTLNERRDRAILVDLLEEKSLVIYDRLYFSEDLVRQHEAKIKCYFLARCKKDASAEVTAFDLDVEKTLASTTRYGKPIHFIKVTHPKTSEIHLERRKVCFKNFLLKPLCPII